MSATFILTLDTTAPQLTWGALPPAYTGSVYEAPIELSKPFLISSQAVLGDGTELSMVLEADSLRCFIPSASEPFPFFIHVLTRDDVWNERLWVSPEISLRDGSARLPLNYPLNVKFTNPGDAVVQMLDLGTAEVVLEETLAPATIEETLSTAALEEKLSTATIEDEEAVVNLDETGGES